MKDALLIEFLVLIMLYTVLNNITPILQVRMLRLREVKPLSQGHPARNQQSQDLSPEPIILALLLKIERNARVIED